MLTDIRFKLISLLPVATGAAAALGSAQTQAPALWLSVFGLVATAAIATYNERNNQVYDDLVDRAATLERELSLTEGAFANRPGSWLSISVGQSEWKVDHRWPLTIVYAAAAICKSKRKRKEEVDEITRCLVKTALGSSWKELENDRQFRQKCAILAEPAASPKKRQRACDRIKERIEYFASLSDAELRYYMPLVPERTKAIFMVALLADLSYAFVLKRFGVR